MVAVFFSTASQKINNCIVNLSASLRLLDEVGNPASSSQANIEPEWLFFKALRKPRGFFIIRRALNHDLTEKSLLILHVKPWAYAHRPSQNVHETDAQSRCKVAHESI
jgi:hypothetical protein